MSRLLGLDYGSKTIGVAVSDPTLMIATPLETIFRDKENHLRKSLRRIKEIIEEYNINLIVLGLPLLSDDSIGDRASKTLEFKDIIERKLNIEVILVNEYLTTNEARQILEVDNIGVIDQKKYIDKVAASLILQEYLDNKEK